MRLALVESEVWRWMRGSMDGVSVGLGCEGLVVCLFVRDVTGSQLCKAIHLSCTHRFYSFATRG